jgi:putative redox protein
MSTFTWTKIKYPNMAGLNLAGLLYCTEPKGTIIVVCHGFTGSKEGGGKAVEMAELLGTMGYAVLLFDFSGCGESDGEFADVTLTRHIGDLKTSVEYCRKAGFTRVLTLGRSFGGTTAICLGDDGGTVSGVSAWAAPGALRELFTRLRDQVTDKPYDLLKLSDEDDDLQIKKGFLTDLDSYDVFSRASIISPRPLLVVHGALDDVVPVKNAWSIFETAGEPKNIEIIPAADHQFTGCYGEVWKIYFAWLRQHFPV